MIVTEKALLMQQTTDYKVDVLLVLCFLYGISLIVLLTMAFMWQRSRPLRNSLRESCEMFVKKAPTQYPEGFFKTWPPQDGDFVCDTCQSHFDRSLRPFFMACGKVLCRHCKGPHRRMCLICPDEAEVEEEKPPCKGIVQSKLKLISESTCERCGLDYAMPKRWASRRNCHLCGHLAHAQCMGLHRVKEDLTSEYECYHCLGSAADTAQTDLPAGTPTDTDENEHVRKAAC